jgi:predicted phage gp36 major capsid-like protein
MPQGRGGDVVGKPKVEWSTMAATTTTTGSKIALLADWSGSQVELIPHLFGAANRFPIGARGLYHCWRTGTAVSKPNAFRYLEVK